MNSFFVLCLWMVAALGICGPQIFSAQAKIPSYKNEDACGEFHISGDSDRHLFVVCDGHQGQQELVYEESARFLASEVVNKVGQGIQKLSDGCESIDASNIATLVSDIENQVNTFNWAGTTLSAILIDNDQLKFFAVGDSLQVISKNGLTEQPILPHDAENSAEIKRIKEISSKALIDRGCFTHQTKNESGFNWFCPEPGPHHYVKSMVIQYAADCITTRYTRSLGDTYLKGLASPLIATPEIKTVALDPSIQFVILASDGVFETLVENPFSADDAVKMVGDIFAFDGISQVSTEKAVNKLTKEARQRYSANEHPDDITAIIIAFQWQ